jgi:competence protein ComEA
MIVDSSVTNDFVGDSLKSLSYEESRENEITESSKYRIANSSKKSERNKAFVLKIDINSASLKELMTLKGIGEVIGGRIIEYREKNGKFLKVEDIVSVKGIGAKTLQKIEPFIVVK